MIWTAVRLALGSLGWAKIAMIAGAVLAVVTAGGIIYHKIWERGYARAISDIARQDSRAIQRATTARNAVLDCKARGLRWDQSTGQCSGG